MKIFAPLLGFFLLIMSTPSWGAHPQTVWDGNELQQLRSLRSAPAYAIQAATLQNLSEARKASTINPRDLGGYAMAALIAEHSQAIGNVVTQLGALCDIERAQVPSGAITEAEAAAYNSNPWRDDCDFAQSAPLHGVAIAYDVLYDRLSENTRTRCRAHLQRSAAVLAAAAAGDNSLCQPTTIAAGSTVVAGSGWWRNEATNNHHWVNYTALGLAAQALEGEDSRSATWQQQANTGMKQMREILDLASDGSFHEGIGYQTFGVERMLYYSLGAIRRQQSLSLPYIEDKSSMMRNVGRYILSVQHPNHPRQFTMTHADANWVRPDVVAMLQWAAWRFQDVNAQEAVRRWNLEPRSNWLRTDFAGAYALEYMTFQPSLPGFSASSLPLDIYNSDQESFVMRNSWDYGSSGAAAETMVVAFKSGNLGGRGNHTAIVSGDGYYLSDSLLNISHDHQDDLGLWIYGKGGWLLPEATAYNCCTDTTMDYQSTSWHNTLLFDGQGQLGDDKTILRQTGIRPGLAPAWFMKRSAYMSLHASTDHYAFARGEGSNLYPESLNIHRLQRTVGFSREGNSFIALQDRIQYGYGATHVAEQVFHAMRAKAAVGDTDPARSKTDYEFPWIRLDNSTPQQAFPPSHFSDTALGIRVVAPATYVADFDTQVSNNYMEWYHPNGNFGRVRVRPTAAQTATTFLQVLWPTTNAAWNDRPNVQPLASAAPERGFSVPLAGQTEHWLYNTMGASTSAGAFTLTGSSTDDIAVVRWGTACSDLQRVAFTGNGSVSDTCGGTPRLLLDTGGATRTVEVSFTGARADISGVPNTSGIRFYGPAVGEVRLNGNPIDFAHDGNIVYFPLEQVPVDSSNASINAIGAWAAADGNLSTAWPSSNGNEQWIEFDLGAEYWVNRVEIYFGDRNPPNWLLSAGVSNSYSTVQWGMQDGGSLSFEPNQVLVRSYYNRGGIKARFLKVYVSGTFPSVVAGSFIRELRVFR